MQPGHLNIIDLLMNSEQAAVTCANGRSLNRDERR